MNAIFSHPIALRPPPLHLSSLPRSQEKMPYAKTDSQEMSKVLDSGSFNAESMLRWLKRITKETFDEEPIGAIHDEI